MRTLITDQDITIAPALEIIQPDTARQWLAEHNTENRKIRVNWVEALAREITEGRWMMTGDPIRFDDRGILIDGQHRLAAIVRADVAVPLYVIRGLPLGVRDVIDTNASRSSSDTLAFAGYKNSNAVSGTARIAMARRDGYFRTAKAGTQPKYTNSAILEFTQANPKIAEIVAASQGIARDIKAPSTGAWCYCMWILKRLNEEKQNEFERSIFESRTEGPGDGRHALIRFFTNENPRIGHRRPTPETIFATFRAWNAWRQEESLLRIIVGSGSSGPQGNAIPEPVS